jgi:N-methylhydantoinase A
MAGVVVPAHAGVFSALGLLLAPPRIDLARSVLLDGLHGLGAAVATTMAEAGAAIGGGEVAAYVDLRYRGQSHETTVAYHPGEDEPSLIERFHEAHRRRNGFDRPGDPVEAVTVRAEATLPAALRWEDLPPLASADEARRGNRPVATRSGVVDAAVWRRSGLRPGDEVAGPAVIEEAEATSFIGAGERATIHESGALEVTW